MAKKAKAKAKPDPLAAKVKQLAKRIDALEAWRDAQAQPEQQPEQAEQASNEP